MPNISDKMTKKTLSIAISTLTSHFRLDFADNLNNSEKKKINNMIKKSMDDSELKKHNNCEGRSGGGTDFF